MYQERNKVMETLRWSRWKKLYYTRKEGRAYFMHHGRRYHMDQFMGCCIGNAHGYLTITNWRAMLIRISDDGEAVKVTYTGGES
jgi:hypothetical protein